MESICDSCKNLVVMKYVENSTNLESTPEKITKTCVHAGISSIFSTIECNKYDPIPVSEEKEKVVCFDKDFKDKLVNNFESLSSKEKSITVIKATEELIRDEIDYKSYAGQVLRDCEVGEKDNTFEKDLGVEAFVIKKDKSIGIVDESFRKVTATSFIIESETIDTTDILSLPERIIEKLIPSILTQESKIFLNLMLAACNSSNDFAILDYKNYKESLEELQYCVEVNKLLVDKFLLPREQLGHMKKEINAIDYDPITSKSCLLTGLFGSLWGVNIYVTTDIPSEFIFAVCEARYLGYRQIYNINVIFDQEKNTLKAEVEMSMGIINPRGIAIAVPSQYVNITKILDFKKIYETI